MKGHMIVLSTSGAESITVIDRPPPLDVLQNAVGGYLQLVPYFDKYEGKECVVFCNEEGKLHGLLYNQKATQAWRKAVEPHVLMDMLVGNVVIITGDTELLDAL